MMADHRLCPVREVEIPVALAPVAHRKERGAMVHSVVKVQAALAWVMEATVVSVWVKVMKAALALGWVSEG